MSGDGQHPCVEQRSAPHAAADSPDGAGHAQSDVRAASMRSPVLFLVFNRPAETRRVFDAIRAARPPRLYVAADGPRKSRPGEAARCMEVRHIASAVDWPCELVTLLRDDNLGCKRAVSSAVTWFFEHEPEGIVLEDDCLPQPSFFSYCDELLDRYRDEPSVMCISGDNFISAQWSPEASYYFSRYVHIWGWASWRRAWARYDVDMRDWSGNRVELLRRALAHAPQAIAYWRDVFDRVANGQIDTWDYQWTYACWKHGGLSCMPGVNLISNIGFGEGATHTVSPESVLANLPAMAIATPLRHPGNVAADEAADRWTSAHVFRVDEHRSRFAHWQRRLGSRLRKFVSVARA